MADSSAPPGQDPMGPVTPHATPSPPSLTLMTHPISLLSSSSRFDWSPLQKFIITNFIISNRLTKVQCGKSKTNKLSAEQLDPLIRELDLEKYRGMTTGDGSDVLDIVVEKLRTRFVNTWEGKGSDQIYLKAVTEGRMLPLENPLIDNGAMDIGVGAEDQGHNHPIQTMSNPSVSASSPTTVITSPLSPSNPYSASLVARRQPILSKTLHAQKTGPNYPVSIESTPSAATPKSPFLPNMENKTSQGSDINVAASTSVIEPQQFASRNPQSRVEQNQGRGTSINLEMPRSMNFNQDQDPKQVSHDPYPYLSDLEKRNRLEYLKKEREKKLQQEKSEIDALNTTLNRVSIDAKVNTEPRFENGQNPSGSFLSSIVGKLNKGTEWLVGQQQGNAQDLPLSGQHNSGDGTANPIQVQNQYAENPGAFMSGGLAVSSRQIDHTSQNYQQENSRNILNGGLASSVFASAPVRQGDINPLQTQNSQTEDSQTKNTKHLMNNRLDNHSQHPQYSNPLFPENYGTRPETISTLPNSQQYRSPFAVNEYDVDDSQRNSQVSQYPQSTVQWPPPNQRRVHFTNIKNQESPASAPAQIPIPMPINTQRQSLLGQEAHLRHQYHHQQHSSDNHSIPTQTHQDLCDRVVFENAEAQEDDGSTTLFNHPIPSVQPQQRQQRQSQSLYGMNTKMYPAQQSNYTPKGHDIPQLYATAHTPAQDPPYQHQSLPHCASHPVISNPHYNSSHGFSIFSGPHHDYPQPPYHHPSPAAQRISAASTTNSYDLPCPLTPPLPMTLAPQNGRDFTSFLHDTKKTYKKESLKDKARIEAYQRAMRRKERARKINILVGMANEVREDGDMEGEDDVWGV